MNDQATALDALDLLDWRHRGQPEQRGNTKMHLPRVGVGRLAAREDEVVLADLLDRRGQHLRGLIAVAVQQRRIVHVVGGVGAHRQRPLEGVLGAVWA